jgi:hypothetical protein
MNRDRPLQEHGVATTVTKQCVAKSRAAASVGSPVAGLRFMTHNNHGQNKPSRRVDNGADVSVFLVNTHSTINKCQPRRVPNPF